MKTVLREPTFSANPAVGRHRKRFSSDLQEARAGIRSGQVEFSGRVLVTNPDYVARHRAPGEWQ